MGKKRKGPDLEELLARQICYYCERDFNDQAVLINHQKAKHYRCLNCNKRLNTAGGLAVHMSQVHKESLDRIENALPNRTDPNVEIFGMEGIPEDVKAGYKNHILTEYYKREAEHRAATGNPPPGAGGQGDGPVKKKPKIETTEERKARLAEWKAKKKAEKEGKVGSNDGTPQADTPDNEAAEMAKQDMEQDFIPLGDTETQSPMQTQAQPQNLNYANGAMGFTGGMQFGGYAQSPGAQPNFGPPPGFQPGGYPPPSYNGLPAPPAGLPYHPPPPQWQHQAPHGPPGPHFGGPAQFQRSPAPPQMQQSQPPSNHSKQDQPQRQSSLPSVPGLPQRPSFNTPDVSREDMARLHGTQGAVNKPPYQNGGAPPPVAPPYQQGYNPAMHPGYQPPYGMSQSPNSLPPQPNWQGSPSGATSGSNGGSQPIGDQVDDLIQSLTSGTARPAAGQAPQITQSNNYPSVHESVGEPISTNEPVPKPSTPQPAATASEPTTASVTKSDKKSKKKAKDDSVRLLYSDNATSPEEKMAARAKYQKRIPEKRTETVLMQDGEGTQAVSGPVDEAIEAEEKVEDEAK